MIYTIAKNHIPDPVKKSCYDCYHCQGAVSWWCVNKEAIDWRGTTIPGVIKCPFWESVITWDSFSRIKKIMYSLNPFQIFI